MDQSTAAKKLDHDIEECEEESHHENKIFTKEWFTDPYQSYTGELLFNNLHGHGFYFIEKKDKVFYDGLFYVNKLEGYSQIFYGDGSHFQGLFKDNRRFGPGIFTYPNGDQDVGLWNGYSLATIVVEAEGKTVPKLARTAAGKLKLLKYSSGDPYGNRTSAQRFAHFIDNTKSDHPLSPSFAKLIFPSCYSKKGPTEKSMLNSKQRNLVPVCPEKSNIAFDRLASLGASQEILNKSHKLYNLEIENKNSVFFNRQIYDEAFHSNQDCIIDIRLTENELKEESNRNSGETEDKHTEACVLDLDRVRQISERLTIINRKLESSKRRKANISGRVDYCRECCHLYDTKEQNEGLDENDEHEDNDNLSVLPLELKDIAAEPSQTRQTRVTSIESSFSSFDYSKLDALSEMKVSENVDEEIGFTSVSDYLDDICFCAEDMNVDDLVMLEDQLEAVTKDVIFYETIQANLRVKLDAHVRKTQETGPTVNTKKVLVNDLLAWNNEELSMTMMKHSFLHRRKEYMVTFKVSDLLIGNRSAFASTGAHEQGCTDFLNQCCSGEAHTLIKAVRTHHININVSDACGNTGVFFAVASCSANIISHLVNLGAKLDQVNGEGLTPLCLCLCLYLALKYDISDWEKSFLPKTNMSPRTENEARKWYPNKSLLSMSNSSEKDSVADSDTKVTGTLVTNLTKQDKAKADKPEINVEENYVFDTSYPVYVEPKRAAKGGGNTSKKTNITYPVTHDSGKKEEEDRKLMIQQRTFAALLNCGANPNIGEVPLPPLLMSVFTRNSDLVTHLLESGASSNISTDEELNALHIIASLSCTSENLSIAHVLLQYFCDPTLKCRTGHWREQKIRLVGKNVNLADYEDYGKNPLHLLCLRRDFPLDECKFFDELATLFYDYHVNLNDMYLGHTPLSIAVLVGNTSLVQTLLCFQDTDPYLILGYNMGNILTLFILKRYEDILPLDKCRTMLKLLVDAYVNPLRTIGEFENAIEFMEKEHEIVKVDKGKKKKGKDKGGKGSKKEAKKGGKKGSKKGSKKSKVSSQNVLKEYLKELTRDTIIKFVQMEAVENLYNIVEENMLDYDFIKVLAEYLTPSIALENIAALFNCGKIKACRFDKSICLRLLEFVDKHKRVVKAKKAKKEKNGKKKKNSGKSKSSKVTKKSNKSKKTPFPESEPEPTLADMIDNLKIVPTKTKETLIQPGLDSRTKYQVCFHCLRKRNKALIHCPKCQFIYFCSEQCNKLNIKMKAQHFCNINYYKNEKVRWESGVVNEQENLETLCKKALERCGERMRNILEREREARIILLKEERKLDIYGTRFLKKGDRNATVKHVDGRTYTEITLYGSRSVTDIMDPTGTKYLKTRLTSLSLFEDKYANMLVHRHESSLKQYSMTATTEDGRTSRKEIKSNHEFCYCEESNLSEKDAESHVQSIDVLKKSLSKKKVPGRNAKEEIISKFEAMETIQERRPVVRKLRRMPKKYQCFVEMLSKYFPEEDIPFLLLPYACYSNGHLYYKLDEDVFSRTYSMV